MKTEAPSPLMFQRFIALKQPSPNNSNHLFDVFAYDSATWADWQLNSVSHGIGQGSSTKATGKKKKKATGSRMPGFIHMTHTQLR